MGVFTATAGENLSAGEVCYKKSDGKYWKAQANTVLKMPCSAMAAATILADATGNFYKYGDVTLAGHGFTVGSLLYVSEATPGLKTTTPPATSGDQVQVIGLVESASVILFFPTFVLVEVA